MRILLSMGVLLALGSASTARAASDQPGASCANPSVSALNQYCENIPTATGGRTPNAGTPALGGTLSPQAARAVDGASTATGSAAVGAGGSVHARTVSARTRARRHLLSLPAPSANVPLHQLNGSVGSASPWSLSLTLILILVLIALALGGLALWRWRRRHTATESAPWRPIP